ncbi:MAG: hypothetical protein WKF96_08105 [Solirubrobacteraceae bacterium]
MDRLSDEVKGEVKALRRSMWTVGGGIVTSAIVFALSVLTKFSG